MKLLLLLCLSAITIAGKREWDDIRPDDIREQYFTPKHEYRYLYRGQISTGIPKQSDQHAATRLEAQVSLFFPTDQRTAVLRIRQIRFGSLNDELPEPRELQRFEAFEEKEVDDERLKILQLPLRFRYMDGLVSEIEFDREDKVWSKNIKRSILNMLQINIKKSARTDVSLDRRLRKDETWDESEERQLKRDNVDFFTAHERTIEGDCEVTYTFNEIPQEEIERRETMRITKSINYDKCTKRVDVRYNHRFAEECGKCKGIYEKEEALLPSTVINYRLIGNTNAFLVKDVDLKTQYVLAPLGLKGAALKSLVTCQMQLLNVIEGTRNEMEPRSESKETLVYSAERLYKIERFFMNGDEELDRNHPYREMKNKYELVEQMIHRMVRATSSSELGVEPEAVHQLSRLVDLLRTCSMSEIRTIHRELFEDTGKFDRKTQQKVRDIIVDALSLSSTKNTIQHLIEKIEQRQVSIQKATKALNNLIGTLVVSEKQVDMLLQLCKRDICKRNSVLKQSCLLTVGGLIHALCGQNKDYHVSHLNGDVLCPRQLKEKYLVEMIGIYRDANNRYEKVLALKTIANGGIDLSVYELEKIITDRRQERLIRVQAIDALRKLRSVMPRKIHKILLPIFKDRTEHPEVRTAALTQVIHTLPERTILDQIAQALFYDTSRQVQTFAYSMMQTFAKSENPCERKLADDLQIALRLARVEIPRWSDSKYVHVPMYSQEHSIGITLDMATIFSNDSILPRELMMSLDSLTFGQWRKTTAEIGFVQYNIEQLIDKLWKKTEVDETVTRGTRTDPIRPSQVLRKLFENLKIRSRNGNSRPYAMLYVRRGDLDYAVLPMDAETMPELLRIEREGKIDLSRLTETLTRGYRFNTLFADFFYETYHKMATTIGIPLAFSTKVPAVAYIEGEFKADIKPKYPESPKSIKFYINVKPSVAATHIIDVHTVNPITYQRPKVIHAIKVNIPIDARVELNIDRKIEIKSFLKIPEEKKQILSLQTRFVTSTSSWPKITKTYIEPLDKTAHSKNRQRLLTFDTISEKWIGMRIHVRGQWHGNPMTVIRRSPTALLVDENELEIILEKGRDAPREIITKLEIGVLEDQNMERPQLEGFYSDERYEQRMFSIQKQQLGSESDERHRRQRYNAEESQYRDRSDTHVREYNPAKGYKLRMRIRIETAGSTTQRDAEMTMTTGCDNKIRFCMMDIQARRPPIFEDEQREWTLQAKLRSLYPEVVRSVKELNQPKYSYFNAQVDCEWGSEQRRNINLRIHGQRSRELTQLIERMNEELGPMERYQKVLLAGQLNQYKITANYKVGQYFENYFSRLFDMLKASYVWDTHTELVQNPENKVYAELTIDPYNNELLNIVVETPKEVVKIEDVILPMKITPFAKRINLPSKSVRSFSEFVMKALFNERHECTVSSRHVSTFDDVDIKLPLTTCYSVLAKDCRSEYPKFAVLMRKSNRNAEEKKVKIIDEEHVIELESVGGEMEVRVDGRKVEDEERLRTNGIEKTNEAVIVESKDVTVRFDGQTASVKVPVLYKGGLCGICGHYDGEKQYELRMADNELTDNLEQYSRSYFNNDEECDIEENVIKEKNNYRLEDDSNEFSGEDGDEEHTESNIRKPIMKTKIIEYNNEVCFSMKPVKECPQRTYAREENKTQRKVSFACLPRTTYETTKLLNRAYFEVLNMNKYKASFTEEVSFPETCRTF
uniref:Vitellogenin-6 n=2 Tax=Parascaris TaxID=6254 RepID=A0A915CDH7_PARUN